MVRRLIRTIRHGTLMMVRNLRSYSMLSLSVVLSFSVLLGYLAISDSTLFNQYKNVIYKPDGWTIVHDDQLSAGDLSALQTLTGDAAGGSSYIMCQYGSRFVEAEDRSYSYTFSIYSVPSVTWDIFVPHGIPENVAVSWLDERQENGISLGKGEIVISRQAYDILFAEKTEEPVLPVCIGVQDGSVRWLDCRVVGTLDAPDFFSEGLTISDVNTAMHITVFMSQSTVDEMAGAATPEMTARWAVYNAKKNRGCGQSGGTAGNDLQQHPGAEIKRPEGNADRRSGKDDRGAFAVCVIGDQPLWRLLQCLGSQAV